MQTPSPTAGRATRNWKLIVIATTFGVFSITIALYLIFTLLKHSSSTAAGKNLVVNTGFEEWEGGRPKGWIIENAIVFDATAYFIEGKHSVGVYSNSKNMQSIYQKIRLNPREIYTICFSLKSETYDPKDVGFAIQYEGDHVMTSTEITPGIHYYDGDKVWRQYFGKITGARSVILRFFSRNSGILYADAVKVGINILSTQRPEHDTKE